MGEAITIGTVRVALVLYVVALWLRLGGEPRQRWARNVWALGLAFYLAHVAAAFETVHGWSHADALAATARRSEEMFGIASGFGLWFNYLFTVVWAGDVVWWYAGAAGYRSRPRWVSVAFHAFLAFMFFNGAVVFASGFSRWFGLAATPLLLVSWAAATRRAVVPGGENTHNAPTPQPEGNDMSGSRRLMGIGLVIVLVALGVAGGWLAGRLGLGARAVDPASLSELERGFAERMENVALVGTYSARGRDGRSEDRYEIASVEKIEDGLWRFNARMNCCGVNGDIPVTVPLHWVGDTPMIMMTDTSIPGVGTFTVRLFFYGDRYSGTWEHGDVGGHMSGRIEKLGTQDP